jgi:pimeloyl-ACP methyl ester carboxylesterase/CheY-like chemotaxis protein
LVEPTPIEPDQPLGEVAAADYIRVMRHELRTPVNHIIGYSEMLLDDLGDGAGLAGLHQQLKQIESSGRQLLQAINASIDRADGDPRLLEQLLRDATIDRPIARIYADAEVIEELLAGGPREGWLPDVRKIGAAASNLRTLIETGLTHDAIALGVRDTLHAEERDDPDAEQAGGTILVVEDNDLNRDMLSRRLVKLGFQVVPAEHGRRALELLDQQPIDLILLDIMMPELNGYQTLEQVKSSPALRHIPVIMLSALDELGSVVRCIEMGADDYLTKPFDPVLLRARISACLEKKQLRDKEQVFLAQIQKAKKRADDLLHVVIPLGIAFSAEKGFNRLLERIVIDAMQLCNADGGSLYLRTDQDELAFVIARNSSLGIAMGGTTPEAITFPPLQMYDPETKEPIRRYVVTQAALDRRSILVPDAYDEHGFDFSGTRAFDQRTGYRSTSFLAVPLMDTIGRVIGVLQLLNAQDPETGAVIPFDAGMCEMIESLSALAAAALTMYEREERLRAQIAQMQVAIDEEKRRREVDSITETTYFQNLQSRVRYLRSRLSTTALAGEPVVVPEILPAIPGGSLPLPPMPSAEHTHDPPAVVPEEDPLLAPLRERQRHRQIYKVGDQEIHVQEEGPPSGEIALLIHGWSSSWYAMSPLLDELKGRYRCLAVDLPGYGDSPRLPQATTIAAYADLLADLIRQISGKPVVLIGHSMGGMISLTLALRHPDVVERMVLLCPTISGRLSRWINVVTLFTSLERYSIASWFVAALEPQFLRVTDWLMRPASFAERTDITDDQYHQLRADARRPGQGKVRAECFWAMQAGDLRGRLGVIKTPALVLWGMEDNTVPLRDASVVDDEWPDAELRIIPKAGHWPQFETPKTTKIAIRAFLSKPIKLLKAQF